MKLRELLEPSYKIYCDLDDVLVDFLKGVQEKVNPDIATREGWQKVKKEDWKKIVDMSPNFWAELDWMQDGKQLWNYIKSYDPIILTARPKTDPQARKGKLMWVKKHLGNKAYKSTIVTLGLLKQEHAGKNRILIDDYDRNIKQWRAAGGIGILHKNAMNSIEQLRKYGL
jgi:hypothetical protein